MLTTFAVLAIIFAWFGFQVNKAREQRRAVAQLLNIGMRIHYDYDELDGYWPPRREHPFPTWFRRLFGDDFCVDVRRVGPNQTVPVIDSSGGYHLPSADVSDDDLIHLRSFQQLEQLDLSRSLITDEGLRRLGQLDSLKMLDLGETSVSDSGLAHLKGLTNLTWLRLYGTQVTDAGVRALQTELPNCRITYQIPAIRGATTSIPSTGDFKILSR